MFCLFLDAGRELVDLGARLVIESGYLASFIAAELGWPARRGDRRRAH